MGSSLHPPAYMAGCVNRFLLAGDESLDLSRLPAARYRGIRVIFRTAGQNPTSGNETYSTSCQRNPYYGNWYFYCLARRTDAGQEHRGSRVCCVDR